MAAAITIIKKLTSCKNVKKNMINKILERYSGSFWGKKCCIHLYAVELSPQIAMGRVMMKHWFEKLVGGWATPLKNMSQLGWWDSQYFWENKIDGNQTTNQTISDKFHCLGSLCVLRHALEQLTFFAQGQAELLRDAWHIYMRYMYINLCVRGCLCMCVCLNI